MCNAYRLQAPPHLLYDLFDRARLPVVAPDAAHRPNLEPRSMTRPTQVLPVLRPVDPDDPGAGVELAQIRWGLVPAWHRGGVKDFKFLCTNARSETVATARPYRDALKRRRCLAPADGFYEWTGAKGAKTRWLFEPVDESVFCFAGVWELWVGPDGPLESFSILTTAPGEDARPYHDRQPVVLPLASWAAWLDLKADPTPLFTAQPAGFLKVREAA